MKIIAHKNLISLVKFFIFKSPFRIRFTISFRCEIDSLILFKEGHFDDGKEDVLIREPGDWQCQCKAIFHRRDLLYGREALGRMVDTHAACLFVEKLI